MAEKDPKGTLATVLRQNGYQCQEPKSAEPDPAHTTPDRKAWIVQCETGRCRVKFKGARGAEITPIAD